MKFKKFTEKKPKPGQTIIYFNGTSDTEICVYSENDDWNDYEGPIFGKKILTQHELKSVYWMYYTKFLSFILSE